ncbi:MAG: hypothetical protein V4857_10635 [Pseudomonadota bacterium]
MEMNLFLTNKSSKQRSPWVHYSEANTHAMVHAAQALYAPRDAAQCWRSRTGHAKVRVPFSVKISRQAMCHFCHYTFDRDGMQWVHRSYKAALNQGCTTTIV